MKIAYVCSPYFADTKAGIKKHKQYARELTRWALYSGYVPVTPHLYLTEVTDDNNSEERQLGLGAGIKLLDKCDLLLIGDRFGISCGMASEIVRADATGKQILVVTDAMLKTL